MHVLLIKLTDAFKHFDRNDLYVSETKILKMPY